MEENSKTAPRWFGSADLGGTNIAMGICDAAGSLLAERTVPTQSHLGPASVIERIAIALAELAAEAGGPLAAVGMGVPGLVNKDGTTLFLPNLPTQWRNIPVAAELRDRLGCPVYLLNDARLATLGELSFGRGREAETLVFFTIGTGIGGGVAIDGRLRLGPLGAAGELGHQTIVPDGPLCGCGSHGCLEAIASGPAISAEGIRLMRAGQAPRLDELTGGSADLVTPQQMSKAAGEGDEAVAGALRRAGTFLGIGVANVVTALHPDLVVLGGGVSGTGELLIGAVRSEVLKRVRMFPAGNVRIEYSDLKDKAGLYGGFALAMRGGLQTVA